MSGAPREAGPEAKRPAWAMTQDEFIGPSMVGQTFSFDARKEEDEYGFFFEAPYDCEPLWTSACGGYGVHAVDDWDPHPTVVLVHDGEVVGFYAAGQAWIDEPHRGLGLGAEMIVAAAEWAGGAPNGNAEGLGFSAAGFNAHVAAHRTIVERAVERGEPVPAEVLAEYEGRASAPRG